MTSGLSLIPLQRLSGAQAWMGSFGRLTDQLLELDEESLRNLAIYLDPSDPVTAHLISHHVANVSSDDVEVSSYPTRR
jgi:hypothetical protein